MKVIKRSGVEVEFDLTKIIAAITKANNTVAEDEQMTPLQIQRISDRVMQDCDKLGRTPSVEEIQDLVETQIMAHGAYEVAKNYVKYRYTRGLVRQANTTDEKILSLIELQNEEAKQENSNKNPVINSTQRDYMAGEVSRDLTERILLPQDIVQAHKEGIIHFHDGDYYAQHMHNCFDAHERFVTNDGDKAFADFNDGDTVIVLDKDGVERAATVHCYGEQAMNKVTFIYGNMQKIVTCTPNHRWILADGDVTTDLKVGNVLYAGANNGVAWVVEAIEAAGNAAAWCVEEPVTHSFTLTCGMVTGNCDLVNLDDMLQNGTVITGTLIEKPHSFATACNIATQIVAQVASNQYGGQSISLTHLAPFVDVSRQKIKKTVREEMKAVGANPTEEVFNAIVEKRVRDEIRRGVQTIQYQVVTLLTTNGQAPFITVFMYLGEARNEQEKKDLAIIIEEMLEQRYQGVKNEKGVWISPAFPKLIYVLEEQNIHEDSPYYYLTKLAAKCSARRLVPDYISEKKMLELKGDVYVCMGCRSFLTPDRFTDAGIGNVAKAKNYEEGKHKYYGRFNQGVVTLNLPDIALSSNGDFDKFWKIFDERLDLCYRALMLRHERLKGTPSDVAPILWQYGALARLEKGETIDKLLYNGYSTISLGYAGLYECVKYMTGKSHTDPSAKPFALKVMKHMNDACAKWKKETNIDFSIYGTPIESTTYKFAKCLQKRFGIIEGVTDKSYITNSYHVHVTEKISAFDKLAFEAEFQHLSPGGAISYVEIPDMKQNLEAVMQIIRFIYDHIIYAELNSKSDYCQECGFDGEIQIVKKDGKLIWHCPNCGNEDQNKMNVARRTCGYIGTQFWNQGRTAEIADRVLHVSNDV